MKIKPDLSKNGIKTIYEDNKDYLVPLFVTLCAVVLFIVIVFPQLLDFPSKKSQRDIEITRLNEIKLAKETIQKINTQKLDSDLKIAQSALPSEKNFEIILNAISSAASLSNSQISDYQYSDGMVNLPDNGQESKRLDFELIIEGGVDQAVKFLDELNKTFPISEATKIDYSGGFSEISLVFYYNPFVSGIASETILARPVTPEEQKALVEISKWNLNTLEQGFTFPISSTSSAVRTSPFN